MYLDPKRLHSIVHFCNTHRHDLPGLDELLWWDKLLTKIRRQRKQVLRILTVQLPFLRMVLPYEYFHASPHHLRKCRCITISIPALMLINNLTFIISILYFWFTLDHIIYIVIRIVFFHPWYITVISCNF